MGTTACLGDRSQNSVFDGPQTVRTELNAWDMHFPFAYGVVTFFDGSPIAAKLFLKERLEDIVVANPWLAGKMEARNGKSYLSYEPSNPHPEDCLCGVLPALWAEERNFGSISCCGALQPYICGPGGSQFFRIALLTEGPLEDAKGFALCVTVSHIICDGFTFYSIYSMLDANATIVKLDPARPPDLLARENELFGGMQLHFNRTAGAGLLLNVFRPKRQVVVYEVDVNILSYQKDALAQEGGVKFVSVNDIITAALFKATACDLGFMAVNMRNKIAEYTDTMAGNLESAIWYTPSDVSPALIRKSLTPQPGWFRAGEPRSELPNSMTLLKGRQARITNWASFHRDICFEGAQQTMHLPLWSNLEEISKVLDFCNVFRPCSGRLCLICTLHPKAQVAFEAELQGALRRL